MSGVSSPARVRGKAPAEIDFFVFLIQRKCRLTAFNGKNSGEACSIACLRALNSEEARASVPHRLHRICSSQYMCTEMSIKRDLLFTTLYVPHTTAQTSIAAAAVINR